MFSFQNPSPSIVLVQCWKPANTQSCQCFSSAAMMLNGKGHNWLSTKCIAKFLQFVISVYLARNTFYDTKFVRILASNEWHRILSYACVYVKNIIAMVQIYVLICVAFDQKELLTLSSVWLAHVYRSGCRFAVIKSKSKTKSAWGSLMDWNVFLHGGC